MDDSGILVAEDPEGCRDEFAPPQTCAARVNAPSARPRNVAATHLPACVERLEAIRRSHSYTEHVCRILPVGVNLVDTLDSLAREENKTEHTGLGEPEGE